MGLTEEVRKVATATVSAMSSQPLAIALLVVNIGFLAFAGFVLGKVAANAQERNKTQMDLIGRLADDLTNCRAEARSRQKQLDAGLCAELSHERARPAIQASSVRRGDKVLADRESVEEAKPAQRDSSSVPTIGLGHTSAAGPPIVREGMRITEAEAEEIFRADAMRFRQEVAHLVKAPLHQHEFDALASWLFNIGSTNFRTSTALKRLNAGDYSGCAEAMEWWNKPSSIISRRRAEVEQFRHGRYVARM